MSTSLLYHGWGIVGYQYQRTFTSKARWFSESLKILLPFSVLSVSRESSYAEVFPTGGSGHCPLVANK